MADNDAEIAIGVNLDADGFRSEYQAILKDLEAQTKKVIKGTMDNLSGAASKDWGELPFSQMHNSVAGKRIATQAFLSSLSHDLQSQGIGPGSLGYQSALLNASYRVSTPDPWQRWHQMAASGYTQQADATHPDTALGKTIETDYALMSQSWARQYVTKTDNMYRGKQGQYIDFKKMREYAVDAGLGRWIDPDKEHTADNFELIDNELEKIEEKSDNTKKVFSGWNDTLKGVLGTLTAIGSLTYTTIKLTEKAEKMTVQGAASMDKRRAFIGMSALDELRTRVASRGVGLGENSIRDEIYSMSENIEEYKLLGQGDALPPALLGIFNNLMSSDNPYDIYTQSADEIYEQLKGADKDTRKRWLMLMNKAGLGSMSSLVGQFLSNPDYAKTYGTPSKLFALENNPYYGVYGQQELLTPQIAKLNESLKASYNQMAKDWENTFGVKFKSWWDDVMKEKIVPWFQKFLGFMDNEVSGGEGSLADDVSDTIFIAKVDALNKQVGKANAPGAAPAATWERLADYVVGDKQTFVLLPKGILAKDEGVLNKSNPLWEGINSSDPWKFYKALETATEKGASSPYKETTEATDEFAYRAGVALNWLTKTGYLADFKAAKNGKLDDEGLRKVNATAKVLRAYMTTGNYDETLSAYGEASYLASPGFEYIAQFLEEYKEAIRNDVQKQQTVVLKLLDPFGRDLAFDVAEDIIGGDFKFTNRQNANRE